MTLYESDLAIALRQINEQRRFRELVDICYTIGRTTIISYNTALRITTECVNRRLSAAEAEATMKYYAKR